MKKFAKITLDIISLIATLIVLIVFGFYLYLNQKIDMSINKELYDYLVEEINASKDLPDRFYEMYGQVTGFTEKSTTNKYLFKGLMNLKSPHFKNPCPCIDATYDLHINYRATIDKWNLGVALDKDASPKKCLDYYLSKFYFLYNTFGIQNASRFYYQKDLEQLTDDEMLELAIMTLNPSFYNKIRNPERLQRMVEEIKKKHL